MLRLAISVGAALATAAVGAPLAGAEYQVYLCSGPGAAEPLGPPGLGEYWPGPNQTALFNQRCAKPGEPLSVVLGGPVGSGEGAGFRLAGQAGLEISSLVLRLTDTLNGCGAGCGAEAYLLLTGSFGSKRVWSARRERWGGAISLAGLTGVQGFEVGVGCAPEGLPCSGQGEVGELELPFGVLNVVETAQPTASLAPLPQEPLAGTATFRLKAEDFGGSGLLRYRAAIDGAPAGEEGPVGSPSPSCRPLPYASGLAYPVLVPCPQAGEAAIPLDTNRLADGTHTLQVTVETAAERTALAFSGRFVVENKPQLLAPVKLPAQRPVVGQPFVAGEPSFAARPGDLLGTVHRQWELCAAGSCTPIPGAEGQTYLPLASQVGKALRYAVTAEATAAAPASGDRADPLVVYSPETLPIAPPPPCSGCKPVVAGSNRPWRVVLKVVPRLVHRHSWITLKGRVITRPLPPRGKLLLLEARAVVGRVKGPWITFMALRSNRLGRFRARYRFKLGGRHTYQFRVVAPAEGLYRNPAGSSRAVTVKER